MATAKTKTVRGIVLGAVGASLWGLSAVLIGLLTERSPLDPCWIGFVRMLVAGVIVLIIALATNRSNLVGLLHDRRALLGTFIFAVFGMAVFQVTWVMAISTAGAAADGLITQVSLVYVMIYACRTEHRRPRKAELVGVALALAGVYCIATKGDPSTLAVGGMGLVFCLIDSVLQFIHNTAPLYALRTYGSFSVNAVGSLMAAVMLVPFAHPWDVAVLPDATGWALLAASTLLGAIVGYLMAMQGLKDAGPLAGSLTLVCEPLASVVFSALLLGTAFTPFDYVGMGAIFAMMVVMTFSSAQAEVSE